MIPRYRSLTSTPARLQYTDSWVSSTLYSYHPTAQYVYEVLIQIEFTSTLLHCTGCGRRLDPPPMPIYRPWTARWSTDSLSPNGENQICIFETDIINTFSNLLKKKLLTIQYFDNILAVVAIEEKIDDDISSVWYSTLKTNSLTDKLFVHQSIKFKYLKKSLVL